MVRIKGYKEGTYAVVDRYQLNRVKASLQPELDPREEREAKRQMLRERSNARVKNWGNTMEGKRLQKEQLLLQKLQEEEERRRELDAREEELRQAERQKQITKANKQLFLEDDRVKEFHSQLLLCEVMKERDMQKTVKDQIKKQEEEREKAWVKKQERVNRKAQRAQRRIARQSKEQAASFRQIREQQLVDMEARRAAESKARADESRRIREEAEAEVQRVLEEERLRKQKQKELSHTYYLANEEQKKVKAQLREKELAEERKQEEYAKKKQQQLEERQRREKERFEAKLAQRQKLIDDQTAILDKLRSDRKDAFLRDVEASENKHKAREEAKERRAHEIKAQIDRSRAIAMEMREAKRQRDAEHDRLVTEAMKRQAAALAEEERQEVQAKRRKAENIQGYLKKQMEQRDAQKAAEKKAERKLRRYMKKAVRQTDDYFNAYVREVTEEMLADGFDPKPLRKFIANMEEEQ